jgi:hypothetical protein
MPRPNSDVPLISCGFVREVLRLEDGVDLRVQAGCGNPNCAGCRGLKVVVWTKIVPTNYKIKVGDFVAWKGDKLFWKGPRVSIQRMGKYRRIKQASEKE